MHSKREWHAFELIFHGREPELNAFSSKFFQLRWASKHIRRLAPPEIQFQGGAPAELIILLISLTANFVTIADILVKRLNQGKDSIIRVGNKKIQLEGSWKAEEIADIIHIISKKSSKEEVLKQIEKIKSTKITEVNARLNALEDSIHKYEELVETFNTISNKKVWQIKRQKEYQKRLAELQKEENNLKSFIDFLSQSSKLF